jgi:hypothetical protein
MTTYLLTNHLCNAWIAMTKRVHCNASREVQVLPVLHIPHIASFTLLEHGWWTDIGRNHVWELLIDKAGSFGA